MPFDQKTRNLLQRTVTACRKLLDDEFAAQRRGTYGINDDGTAAPLTTLAHLPDEDMQVAQLLRDRLDHLVAGLVGQGKKEADARKEAVGRLTREQAFTVLNRLAALRMAEERGIVLECVRHGLQSEGFLLFQQSAGSAFGDTWMAYRAYIFVLFDELAVDLGVLFSRWDPAGLLFPRQEALEAVLGELGGTGNAAVRDDLTPEAFNHIWAEDETIGWIYQYYNDPAERKKMRDESAAPRNSRELAVRNQFFTPRYVVEFLTDNTLGRIWYEMTKGKTRLKDQCRYLVRRPNEIFLPGPETRIWHDAEGVAAFQQFSSSACLQDLPENPALGVLLGWVGLIMPEHLMDGLTGIPRPRHEIVDTLLVPLESGILPEQLASSPPVVLLQLLWRLSFEFKDNGYGVPMDPVLANPVIGPIWTTLRQILLHPPDNISQEDLLKQPVFIPHRPLKDPREILMLDPACGSLHFGLYAFDLFEVIYQEAWEMGVVKSADYGTDCPPFPHDSVRLKPGLAKVLSNDTHKEIDASTARVVMLTHADPGDGLGCGPYLAPPVRNYRPQIAWEIPFVEFDYQKALAEKRFSQLDGERFVRETKCWDHDLADPLSHEEARQQFLRDVPRLIIEHNIHGIDIDPRCAQIAGLSLWLRAQKSWQRLGLTASQRPTVTRSNIVCAEPMPGEKELLREFVEREFPAEERGVFLRLLEVIFDKMQLAGEAGSLLKIEEEIRSAIAEAKKLWKAGPQLEQSKLFAELEPARQKELKIDLSGITDEQFWDSAEPRIYAALRDFAEQAENGGGFQRRLFAEDAARGFAFIDVCRKRYDVALMNPPFGEPATIAKTYIEKGAGASKADIYTAFLARWCCQLNDGGRLGAITPRSFIYQVDFHDFRKNYLLKQGGMPLLVELGFGELDGATNRTAAYLLVPSSSRSDLTLYANLSDDGDKAGRLHALFSDISSSELRSARLEDFDTDTSSQLLFRLSPSFRALLLTLPKLDPVLGKAHKGERNGVCNIVNGLQCPSDFRYVRLTVEVPTGEIGSRWQLFLKPLEFAPYISELACVVNWHKSGAEQKAEYEGAGISPSKYISGENFYPSGGVWFPDVSERGIGAALIPFTALPGRKGLLAVGKIERDIPSDALAGYLNSIVAEGVLGLTTPERHHKPSYMGQIPWLRDETIVRASAEHYWRMCAFAAVEASSELGGSFLAPTISLRSTSGLRGTIRKVVTGCEESVKQMEREQTSFDELILHRLEASSTDIALLGEMSNRAKIHDWFPTSFSLSESTEYDLVADLVSYWVGAAYGRWNLEARCSAAVNAERITKQHALERCPPGQLQNAQGLPARLEDVPAAYPVKNIPWDGILVDDANHPLDIERRVREVIGIIWGGDQRSDVRGQKSEEGTATPESIEHEACEILGVKSLREYFRKPAGFFADHLKRYSKSRRQAPIYWPLSTASGSYTLWIYYHRLDGDTLYKCLQQFVEPKIKDTEDEIHRLRTMLAADEAGTKERKQLADAEVLLTELRALHVTLLHWAPRWKPNLNDGVVITASPLWELFRLPKWQKTLKETWQALEKGDYDWAHLALTLWPDRVRDKCKRDRSLAIAHNLEDLCEIKAPEPKKKAAKKAGKKKGKMAKNEDDEPELIKED